MMEFFARFGSIALECGLGLDFGFECGSGLGFGVGVVLDVVECALELRCLHTLPSTT